MSTHTVKPQTPDASGRFEYTLVHCPGNGTWTPEKRKGFSARDALSKYVGRRLTLEEVSKLAKK